MSASRNCWRATAPALISPQLDPPSLDHTLSNFSPVATQTVGRVQLHARAHVLIGVQLRARTRTHARTHADRAATITRAQFLHVLW